MTVEQAIDALAGNSTGSKSRAQVALEKAGPDAIPVLLRVAASSMRDSHEANEAAIACIGVLTGMLGLILTVAGTYTHCATAMLGVPMLAFAAWWHVTYPDRTARQKAAALASERAATFAREYLLNWSDLRGIGPLCESLPSMYPSYYVPPIQGEILTRLLPRMTASDGQLLSSEHRARLYPYLQIDNAFEHADFLIAILHAIEQLADARAIPYVRELAGAAVTTVNGTRVRTHARRCLPVLKEREEAERLGRTLLRASDGPVAGNDLLRPANSSEGILLRPSGGGSDTPPNLLVRAAERDEGA